MSGTFENWVPSLLLLSPFLIGVAGLIVLRWAGRFWWLVHITTIPAMFVGRSVYGPFMRWTLRPGETPAPGEGFFYPVHDYLLTASLLMYLAFGALFWFLRANSAPSVKSNDLDDAAQKIVKAVKGS